MNRSVVVAGTNTEIGKTVAAAALVAMLDADYWKPIQAGLDGETDKDVVIRLAGIDPSRAHAESYRLKTPASPDRAAELDGIAINTATLIPPVTDRTLVIELAGGLLVPLNRKVLQIDVIARWNKPTVLVTSTQLGTINHTLLSVEAMRARAISLVGILFMGNENAHTQRTIANFTHAPALGRLPHLDPLERSALRQAAQAHIDLTPLYQAWEAAS